MARILFLLLTVVTVTCYPRGQAANTVIDRHTCFSTEPYVDIRLACPRGTHVTVLGITYGANLFGLCSRTPHDCTRTYAPPPEQCGQHTWTYRARRRLILSCKTPWPSSYAEVLYTCKEDIGCSVTASRAWVGLHEGHQKKSVDAKVIDHLISTNNQSLAEQNDQSNVHGPGTLSQDNQTTRRRARQFIQSSLGSHAPLAPGPGTNPPHTHGKPVSTINNDSTKLSIIQLGTVSTLPPHTFSYKASPRQPLSNAARHLLPTSETPSDAMRIIKAVSRLKYPATKTMSLSVSDTVTTSRTDAREGSSGSVGTHRPSRYLMKRIPIRTSLFSRIPTTGRVGTTGRPRNGHLQQQHDTKSTTSPGGQPGSAITFDFWTQRTSRPSSRRGEDVFGANFITWRPSYNGSGNTTAVTSTMKDNGPKIALRTMVLTASGEAVVILGLALSLVLVCLVSRRYRSARRPTKDQRVYANLQSSFKHSQLEFHRSQSIIKRFSCPREEIPTHRCWYKGRGKYPPKISRPCLGHKVSKKERGVRWKGLPEDTGTSTSARQGAQRTHLKSDCPFRTFRADCPSKSKVQERPNKMRVVYEEAITPFNIPTTFTDVTPGNNPVKDHLSLVSGISQGTKV